MVSDNNKESGTTSIPSEEYIELKIGMTYLLIIALKEPNKHEIELYESADIFLKLIKLENAILILFKLGDLEWSDVSFTPGLFTEEERLKISSRLKENQPKRMDLIVIDADSEVVEVNRVLNFSEKFGKSLNESLLALFKQQPILSAYDAEIKELYDAFTPAQLAISNRISASSKINGTSKKVYKEVVFDSFGYGTNKKIPDWIYNQVHKRKAKSGILTKEFIPEKLQKKGVLKAKYLHKKKRYLYAELYKIKSVRRK